MRWFKLDCILPLLSLLLLGCYALLSGVPTRVFMTMAWWGAFINSFLSSGVVINSSAHIPDVCGLFLYGAATLLILVTAFLITLRLDIADLHLRILSVGCLVVGLIVLYCLLLGTFVSALDWKYLLVVTMVGALSALAISKPSLNSTELRGAWVYGQARLKAAINEIFASYANRFLASLIFLMLAWITLQAFMYFPMSEDGCVYHLPPIAQWLQDRRFSFLDVGIFMTNTYPMNVNLCFLWNMIFIGNDSLVRGTQIVFLLLSVIAVYALARQLRLARSSAFMAACMLFFTPVALAQASVAYIDIGFSALLLCALAFLFAHMNSPSMKFVLLFGISAGLMAGAKSNGILFAGVLFFLLVANFLARYINKKQSPMDALMQLSLALSFIVFLAGYWYARAWWNYGSPFWPLSVSLFGIQLPFPNKVSLDAIINYATWNEEMTARFGAQREVGPFYSTIISWFELLPYYVYNGKAHGGLGPIWIALGLPALFLCTIDAYARRSWKMVIFSAVIITLLILQPGRLVPRYTLYLSAAGGIGFAYCIDRMHDLPKKIMLCLFYGLVVFSAFVCTTVNAEDYYRPEHLSRFLTEGRIHCKPPFDIEEYNRHVASGSVVGFVMITRDLYSLFGSDLTLKPRVLNDDPESLWRNIRAKKIEYIIMPADTRTAQYLDNCINAARLCAVLNEFLLFEIISMDECY